MTSQDQDVEDTDEDYSDDLIILVDLQEEIRRNRIRNTLLIGSKITTEEKPDARILDENTLSDVEFVDLPEDTSSDIDFVDFEEIVKDDILIENGTTAALPVTFFDIPTNVELLNECRPLSIKVVDCDKHSWYYKNYKKSGTCSTRDDEVDETNNLDSNIIENHYKNLISSECSQGYLNMSRQTKPRIYPVNIAPYIDIKNHVITNNDSEVTPVKKRSQNLKIADKIAKLSPSTKTLSQVDLKRNKGLVGLKILQTSALDERLFNAKCHKSKIKINSKNTGRNHSEKDKSRKKSDVWVINKNTCEGTVSSVPVSECKYRQHCGTDLSSDMNADKIGQFSNKYDLSTTKIVLSRVKNQSTVTDLKMSDVKKMSSKSGQNSSGDATNIFHEKCVSPKNRLLNSLSYENGIECKSKLDKTEFFNYLKITNTIMEQVRADKTVASEENAKEDQAKRSANTKINDKVKKRNMNLKKIGKTKEKKPQKYDFKLLPMGGKNIFDNRIVQHMRNTVILGNNNNLTNVTTRNYQFDHLNADTMHIDDLTPKSPISQQMFYKNKYDGSRQPSKADESLEKMQPSDVYTTVDDNKTYSNNTYVPSQGLNQSDSCRSKKRLSKSKKAYEKSSVNNASNNVLTTNNMQTKKMVTNKNGVPNNSISNVLTNLSAKYLTATEIDKPKKIYKKRNHKIHKNKVLKHNPNTQSLATNIRCENQINSKFFANDLVQNWLNRHHTHTVFSMTGSCTDQQTEQLNTNHLIQSQKSSNLKHGLPKHIFMPSKVKNVIGANSKQLDIKQDMKSNINSDRDPMNYNIDVKQSDAKQQIQTQQTSHYLKHAVPKQDIMANTSNTKNIMEINTQILNQQRSEHLKHGLSFSTSMPSANTRNTEAIQEQDMANANANTKIISGINTQILNQQRSGHLKHELSLSTSMPSADIRNTEVILEQDMANASNSKNFSEINTQILNQQRSGHLKHELSLSTSMPSADVRNTEAIPERDMANASNSKNISGINTQILKQQRSGHLKHELSLSTSMPNADVRNTEAIPERDMVNASNSKNISGINTQILKQQRSGHLKHELSLSTSMPNADIRNTEAIPEQDMANASNSKNISGINTQILNQQRSGNLKDDLPLSTSMPSADKRNTEAIPEQDMANASNLNNISVINTRILNQQRSYYFEYALSLSTSMPNADKTQLDTKQKIHSQQSSVKHLAITTATNPKNLTETDNKQLHTNQNIESQKSSNFSKYILPTQTMKHGLSIQGIMPSTENFTNVDKNQLESSQVVSRINSIEKSGSQSVGNNTILPNNTYEKPVIFNKMPCQVSEINGNPGLPIETHVSNRCDPRMNMCATPPRMSFNTARYNKPPVHFIPPNTNGPRFITQYLNSPQQAQNLNDPRCLTPNLIGPPIKYVHSAPNYDSMPLNTNMAVDNISSCTKNDLPWYSVHSPPWRAPPPPVQQPSKHVTSIAGSTIIGKNDAGVVRKINIVAAPVTENQVENIATSLSNIKATVHPDITPVSTKKEMLEELSKGLDFGSPFKEDLKRHVTKAGAHPNLSKILERKPKPGPLSKKPKLDATVTQVQTQISTNSISHKGYSPPILPIPTFQKSFEMIEHVKLVANSAIEKQAIKKDFLQEKSPEGGNIKKMKKEREEDDKQQDKPIKKISLDEYKKRVSTVEGKFAEWDDIIKSENVSKKFPVDDNRRPSFEQDLGYDSDSTIRL